MQATDDSPDAGTALALPNRIRVETALSRFPIHRLAKKDTTAIDLQQHAEGGEAHFKWEVTPNQKYGPPGPLAYKVDTLIVNRRLDESGRPLPGVIRLGSLTEICAAMGIGDSGENRANVRKALHQNASAYITAKIRYRTKSGKERWSEIGYTRYSVVFTGEMLPDGNVADAVYIVPNTSYAELLNQVEVRPLDYDYLLQLAPGPQRFYELVSFQMFGALAGGRPRAKLLYSEYCDRAPQVRYPDFDRVKKQMYKIHAPHRGAGYIMKVEYQETTDALGDRDWEMFCSPGPKAVAEFEAFARRRVRQENDRAPMLVDEVGKGQSPNPADQSLAVPTLLDELMRRGIAERKAAELLADLKPNQHVMDQLEYVDSLVGKDHRGKLANPPGLYIKYIFDNITPPANFLSSRMKVSHAAQRQAREAKGAQVERLKHQYEMFCASETTRYIQEALPADVYNAMLDAHRRQNRALFATMPTEELEALTQGTVRSEVRHSGRVTLLTWEEFIQNHDAETIPA